MVVVDGWMDGWFGMQGKQGLTTLSVPMRRFGGVALAVMMVEMNLDVIPIMAIREIPWKRRASWKVAPKAP